MSDTGRILLIGALAFGALGYHQFQQKQQAKQHQWRLQADADMRREAREELERRCSMAGRDAPIDEHTLTVGRHGDYSDDGGQRSGEPCQR